MRVFLKKLFLNSKEIPLRSFSIFLRDYVLKVFKPETLCQFCEKHLALHSLQVGFLPPIIVTSI